MKHLPTVTLICVDCYNYAGAVDALKKSLDQIKPARTVFLTNIDIELEDIEVIQIPTISSTEEYSRFVVKKLRDYFHTQHCLLVQHDGYVLDGSVWDEAFLKYDYIGAPWLYQNGRNVGNGGFSLRSHRLQNILAGDNSIDVVHPEDEIICRYYSGYLEQKYNIQFSPEELAHKFSFELNQPIQSTFGFHNYFHSPYKPVVVIKRTGAMGDVVMTEPVIDYFLKKGCTVYLDTLPQFMGLFYNYKGDVRHISQMDKRIKPYKSINLDMSYETFPTENVLETYYRFAGINDGQIRNAKLEVNKNAHKWMFEKYVVIHIDDTGMPHRNIQGVEWIKIEEFLKENGYLLIQVGKKTGIKVGIQMYTEEIPMLMYLLAGAELVIGIDSGITQIATALGIPSVIFTGSVDLRKRYQDLNNISIIKKPCHSEQYEYCYHSKISTTGVECIYNPDMPPCTRFWFYEDKIIEQIKNRINGNLQSVANN